MSKSPKFRTKIWCEEASNTDPFQPENVYCHGYNVYKDVIGNASFSEYILTLFLSEKPSEKHRKAFDVIAVALGNLGPRDEAIRAAMNSAVGGAPAAASLMSALAVSAGNYQGTADLKQCIVNWQKNETDLNRWQSELVDRNSETKREDIWEPFEHFPGFLPHSETTPAYVLDLISKLNSLDSYPVLLWLAQNVNSLENIAKCPIGINMVVSATFYELGFSPEQAEICSLILKLPGAAVHGLEAKCQGWRNFPFFGEQIELSDDPGEIAPLPNVEEYLGEP